MNNTVVDLDFSGFPEFFDKMVKPTSGNSSEEAEEKMTWEELQERITLRNVPTIEVYDLLFVLESMSKNDISLSAYQNAREDMEGYMFEIKQLHASFRREAAENDLLQHAKFLEDSKALVK